MMKDTLATSMLKFVILSFWEFIIIPTIEINISIPIFDNFENSQLVFKTLHSYLLTICGILYCHQSVHGYFLFMLMKIASISTFYFVYAKEWSLLWRSFSAVYLFLATIWHLYDSYRLFGDVNWEKWINLCFMKKKETRKHVPFSKNPITGFCEPHNDSEEFEEQRSRYIQLTCLEAAVINMAIAENTRIINGRNEKSMDDAENHENLETADDFVDHVYVNLPSKCKKRNDEKIGHTYVNIRVNERDQEQTPDLDSYKHPSIHNRKDTKNTTVISTDKVDNVKPVENSNQNKGCSNEIGDLSKHDDENEYATIDH